MPASIFSSPISLSAADGLFLGQGQEAVALLGDDLARQVHHVRALVVVALQRRVLAQRLQVAPVEGLGEGAHLACRRR